MQQYDVSVIITAYNMEEFIQQCIESVLNQTQKNIEIIVVLDKPTDNTETIVKVLASQHDNIKVVENPVNVGAGLSRRYGLSVATSEYTLLLDGDDWLEPDFIETLYKSALETGADIVSGGITVNNEDGSYNITSYGNTTTEGYDKVTKFWGERIVFMNNKLIRRKLHQMVPYCHRRFIEDTPVIIPQLHIANKVVYVDNCGYHYRMNPNSLTHKTNELKTTIYRGLCWCDLIDYFNKYDPQMFEHMPLKNFVTQILQRLNQGFSIKDIEEYKEDYLELMTRLFDIIQITNISWK